MTNANTNTDKNLCRTLGGDDYRNAFEWLYRKYYQRLYAISYRHMRDKDEARDMVQEVFLKMLEIRHDMAKKGIESLEGYLVRSIQNLCKSTLRKTQNRRNIMDRIGQFFQSSYRLDSTFDKELVLQCLQRIPNANFREMLILHAQGYKNDEIAQQLGKEPTWVRKRKPDAKKAFEKQLKRIGLTRK